MGAIVSFFSQLFGGMPDPCNATNDEIEKYHETKRQGADKQAGADLAATQKQAKTLIEEAVKKRSEHRERGADAKRAAQLAGSDAKPGRQRGERLETREKEATEKEAKAKSITEWLMQVKPDVTESQEEINAGVLSHQRRVETRIVASTQLEQARESLELVPFCREGLGGNIQPEVWPTEEEYQLAKKRIQYDPEKIHFAVCGGSGSGKSSLVNAFRGLKNNESPRAAPTDVVETTGNITRYSDSQQEMRYKRLVWFDCPGAGTLEVPGWQYFNQQGLFIFDVIVLVYDTRFTEIDLSIIRNCERFKIPLFIVRSKADIHVRNIMEDGANNDDAESNYEEQQEKARRLLIDKTKQNLKMNLERAGLAMHDIFLVSNSVIHSLVTMKPNKNPVPVIDEERLVESILKAACERRYRTRAPAWQSSYAIISRGKNMIGPLPSKFKQGITHQAERLKKNPTSRPIPAVLVRNPWPPVMSPTKPNDISDRVPPPIRPKPSYLVAPVRTAPSPPAFRPPPTVIPTVPIDSATRTRPMVPDRSPSPDMPLRVNASPRISQLRYPSGRMPITPSNGDKPLPPQRKIPSPPPNAGVHTLPGLPPQRDFKATRKLYNSSQ